jgi:hypothetical protein
MASVDSRLIDTSQMAREGSAILIRSQQVRDPRFLFRSSSQMSGWRTIVRRSRCDDRSAGLMGRPDCPHDAFLLL